MINSPRRQDATQRTGRSDQQGLPAQRRKIIHDRLIGPYRNSQQEQKKKILYYCIVIQSIQHQIVM